MRLPTGSAYESARSVHSIASCAAQTTLSSWAADKGRSRLATTARPPPANGSCSFLPDRKGAEPSCELPRGASAHSFRGRQRVPHLGSTERFESVDCFPIHTLVWVDFLGERLKIAGEAGLLRGDVLKGNRPPDDVPVQHLLSSPIRDKSGDSPKRWRLHCSVQPLKEPDHRVEIVEAA